MDIPRISQEIATAQRSFEFVEKHLSPNGIPYVLVALQTSVSRYYTLAITFPTTYPFAMPSINVRKPTIKSGAPHRYGNGNICYQHQSTWNPGRHDLVHVISRAAKWLNKYEVWLQTNKWPGAEIRH